jgi:hypothetical protein
MNDNERLYPWGRNFYGVMRESNTDPKPATKRKLLKNKYRRYSGELSFKQWLKKQH